MRRLIVILTLALFSCGFPVMQSANKKAVDLKLNLKKGDRYITTMNADQTMTQSIAGNEMTVTTKMGMVMNFDVTDVDPSGNYQIGETFKKINFEMGGPAAMKFNSDDTTQTDSKAAILKNLVGAELTMKLSPRGKVLELNGAKELMDRMMQSTTTEDSAANQQILKILEGFWSDNGIRRMTEQGLGYVPPNPVKIGDSWKYEATANLMVPVKIANQYTLMTRNKGSISIELKSSLAMDTVMTVGEGQPMTMSISMNGVGNGTMLINEKTGMLDSSNTKIDLSGNLALMGMPSGSDMKIPVTGTVISTLKYEKQ
jgi:hypothetical protein